MLGAGAKYENYNDSVSDLREVCRNVTFSATQIRASVN